MRIRAEEDRIADLKEMESQYVFVSESRTLWNVLTILSWISPVARRIEQLESKLGNPAGLPSDLLKALAAAVRDLKNGSVHACAASRHYVLVYFGDALVAATLDSCRFSDAYVDYPDGLTWHEYVSCQCTFCSDCAWSCSRIVVIQVY